MNKKIKTFLLLILTIIGAFIGIDKVKAEPYGGRLVRGDRIGFTYTPILLFSLFKASHSFI